MDILEVSGVETGGVTAFAAECARRSRLITKVAHEGLVARLSSSAWNNSCDD
jgi:hypothetical protein